MTSRLESIGYPGRMMPLGYSIIDATPDSIEELLPMMRHLYELDDVPFDEDRSRAGILQLPSAFGRIFLCQSASGENVGYLVMTISFSLEHGGQHGFVDELYIRPGHQGHGLGSAMIDHAGSLCKELGFRSLLLEVDLHNEAALRLYRRIGFTENRRRLMTLILD